MTISTITTLPAAPLRSDPTTFADKGDALMTALVAFVPQMNTAINGINSAQSAADTDAATATTAASNANASATVAAASAKASAWVSGATYQQNDCAISQINFQTYRKKTTSAANSGGATDPANDGTNWTFVQAVGTTITKSARSSNTALVASDSQKLIDLTGTFTQTFSAAASLANGWFCFIRNNGTGYITLDPNGSELIDGLTTVVMMPGEVRFVQCDGAAFTSLLINTEGYFFVREEQSSGTSGGVLGSAAMGGAGAMRTLNTVKANTINATLASNQFTIPAGTYRIKARAPFGNTTGAKAALLNLTDSTTTILGSNAAAAANASNDSIISGTFTITASKTFIINWGSQGASTVGGYAASLGIEVYTEVELWKIA